jgi:hypothetical protein
MRIASKANSAFFGREGFEVMDQTGGFGNAERFVVPSAQECLVVEVNHRWYALRIFVLLKQLSCPCTYTRYTRSVRWNFY